jgi:hypothetical protein
LPWSSIGGDQGHAAVAQVKRHHHDLHEDSLMCRSFLYSMQSLVSASEHTRRLQRLSLQISGLKQVRQQCWTGRMAFLSECFDMAKRLLPQAGLLLGKVANTLCGRTQRSSRPSMTPGRIGMLKQHR